MPVRPRLASLSMTITVSQTSACLVQVENEVSFLNDELDLKKCKWKEANH